MFYGNSHPELNLLLQSRQFRNEKKSVLCPRMKCALLMLAMQSSTDFSSHGCGSRGHGVALPCQFQKNILAGRKGTAGLWSLSSFTFLLLFESQNGGGPHALITIPYKVPSGKLPHLVLKITLWGGQDRDHYTHFTDKKTESQRALQPIQGATDNKWPSKN